MTSQEGSTDYFQTADELLERHISSDRLRDIITRVTVLDRHFKFIFELNPILK